MRIIIDDRVKKFIRDLSKTDKGRISSHIDLFEEGGFALTENYLKKISSNLWELRPGRIRLLFGQVGETVVLVNGFVKKTQKTPPQEIKTATNRLKEYQI